MKTGTVLNGVNIFLFHSVFVNIVTSQPKRNRSTYDLIESELTIPQWLATPKFGIPKDKPHRSLLRFPPEERRFDFTNENQEIVQASTDSLNLVPSCAHILQQQKAPSHFIVSPDYQPWVTTGNKARHKIAEARNLRWRFIGSSDEGHIVLLYTPIGWPFILVVGLLVTTFTVPLIGWFLWWAGFIVVKYYYLFFWEPLKTFLRWAVITNQLLNKKWEKYIAPDYFLEPRPSFRMPYVLRNEDLEEIPEELAYKPPINKIDYTMYILSPDDYDESDLRMDEMEYIDDLLQFREENPKAVARLLKYKLGDEKFYNYFDEDILSDSSEDEKLQYEERQVDEEDDKLFYMQYLEMDEPWMHDEFDATWTGPGYQLEEIKKRRQIITTLKDQIKYNHALITAENKYDNNYASMTPEERVKLQADTKRIMDKYTRYSKLTKERVAEIEPSGTAQVKHNVALSKYLPLVDHVSHYNHRLNLKHEKPSDEARRRLQLEIFGA